MVKLRIKSGELRRLISYVGLQEAKDDYDWPRMPARGEKLPDSADVDRLKGVEQRKSGKVKLGDPLMLKDSDSKAYAALLRSENGKIDGELYSVGPYLMFRPRQSSRRSLFWVSPMKTVKQPDGSTALDAQGNPIIQTLPRDWYPYVKLTKRQKEDVGWVDAHDRGEYDKGTKLDPFASALEDEEDRRYAPLYDPSAQVSASIPGATTSTAGKGGGIVSPQASVAADRAFAAKNMKIPDWETLSLQKLQQWHDVVARVAKTSGMPDDKRMLMKIKDTMHDRLMGIPPKALKPATKRVDIRKDSPEAFNVPPRERFGPRKAWGKTSPNVEIERLPTIKKKDE